MKAEATLRSGSISAVRTHLMRETQSRKEEGSEDSRTSLVGQQLPIASYTTRSLFSALRRCSPRANVQEPAKRIEISSSALAGWAQLEAARSIIARRLSITAALTKGGRLDFVARMLLKREQLSKAIHIRPTMQMFAVGSIAVVACVGRDFKLRSWFRWRRSLPGRHGQWHQEARRRPRLEHQHGHCCNRDRATWPRHGRW